MLNDIAVDIAIAVDKAKIEMMASDAVLASAHLIRVEKVPAQIYGEYAGALLTAEIGLRNAGLEGLKPFSRYSMQTLRGADFVMCRSMIDSGNFELVKGSAERLLAHPNCPAKVRRGLLLFG